MENNDNEKDKSVTYSEEIDLDLFSIDDVISVKEKMNKNYELLDTNLPFNKIEANIALYRKKLCKLLEPGVVRLLDKYVNLISDANDYHNCLAYFLGLTSQEKFHKK